jgi:hypothetical protein
MYAWDVNVEKRNRHLNGLEGGEENMVWIRCYFGLIHGILHPSFFKYCI